MKTQLVILLLLSAIASAYGQHTDEIDLRGQGSEDTWIEESRLNEYFGSDETPNILSILSDDPLISAKLYVEYLPTIWPKEYDGLLQYIQFPTLQCWGIKDIKIEDGQKLILKDAVLYNLPANVKAQVSKIAQQDLLAALEISGPDYENRHWQSEKKTWERYIRQYKRRLKVYPSHFHLQLTFAADNGPYTINLYDQVIIGN